MKCLIYQESSIRSKGTLVASKQECDLNYRNAIDLIFKNNIPLILATHNKSDIEYTIGKKIEYAQIHSIGPGVPCSIKSSILYHHFIYYTDPRDVERYLIRRLKDNPKLIFSAF